MVKTIIQGSVENKRMGPVVREVYAQNGLGGFYNGLKPNIARTFLVNAAELGTFDQAKNSLAPYLGGKGSLLCHVASSGLAGFCSVWVRGVPIVVNWVFICPGEGLCSLQRFP